MLNLPIELKATRKLKQEILNIRLKYVTDPREKVKEVVDEYRNEAMPFINELNKRFKKAWEESTDPNKGIEPLRVTFKEQIQK